MFPVGRKRHERVHSRVRLLPAAAEPLLARMDIRAGRGRQPAPPPVQGLRQRQSLQR